MMNMQNTSKKYTYPLFESIAFRQGKFLLKDYHLQRMKRSCITLYGSFNHADIFDKLPIPEFEDNILYKYRIVYNENDFKVEFVPYIPKYIKTIKIIEANGIEYSLKYTDRSAIERLKAAWSEYDEILITQNGFLCDTSIANIVLSEKGKLYTPDTCLLEGVQRAYLLDQKIVEQRSVHIDELRNYDFIIPVNALNGLKNAQRIPVRNIES